MTVAPPTHIAYRTCPLCEAGCGLEITVTDGAVTHIRGDRDDVFSSGYICPKGSTLKQFHDDPNRLRRPVVKRGETFEEVSWDEAFEVAASGLKSVIDKHGRDAVAIYLGNPTAHNLGALLFGRVLIAGLGTRNRFSASTVDQRPKEISAALMFGTVSVPVPDLDRTDYLLMLGANPHASNGSLCTAPDFPGRLQRLRQRGGRLVVVDPRRSETAATADWHVSIRPGTDAHLLAALCTEIVAGGRARTERLGQWCDGLDELTDVLAPFDADTVAPVCGIDADDIRRLAVELSGAPTAAVYGRIGTCTQEFGTLASWLVDVLNIITGNLDRVGGAMFPMGAVGQGSTRGAPRIGRGTTIGRVTSRVSQQPETFGEFSVGVLAEEIETPGEGQVRALVLTGGNPVSSNPNSTRLDAAIASLECVVAIDPYINETTRHATVILPPPSALQKSHYDVALLNFAVRNVANYSSAVLPLDPDQPDEWEIMLRLASAVSGVAATPADAAAAIARSLIDAAVRDDHSPVAGRDADEIDAMLGNRTGPERVLDVMLRVGPYGDGFGSTPDGVTLAALEANPHGIDLGALQPDRVPDVLRTPTGQIDVLPDVMRADLPRLVESLQRAEHPLVLVGRRHVRSNNSWMHNLPVLVRGRNRCTLQIHPDDAARCGVVDGRRARVTSRVGEVVAIAEITDVVRQGVVSLPHGFGQNLPGVRLDVAAAYEGVNTNVLTDEQFRDVPSGNIALNGVPVQIEAV